MKKIALEIIIGFIGFGAGIIFGYLYFKGLNDGNPFWYLALSLICLGVGVFFLFKAANTENKPLVAPVRTNGSNEPGKQSIIERNNQIASEWKHTNDKRDRLKMLEISSNEEKTDA